MPTIIDTRDLRWDDNAIMFCYRDWAELHGTLASYHKLVSDCRTLTLRELCARIQRETDDQIHFVALDLMED